MVVKSNVLDLHGLTGKDPSFLSFMWMTTQYGFIMEECCLPSLLPFILILELLADSTHSHGQLVQSQSQALSGFALLIVFC